MFSIYNQTRSAYILYFCQSTTKHSVCTDHTFVNLQPNTQCVQIMLLSIYNQTCSVYRSYFCQSTTKHAVCTYHIFVNLQQTRNTLKLRSFITPRLPQMQHPYSLSTTKHAVCTDHILSIYNKTCNTLKLRSFITLSSSRQIPSEPSCTQCHL